MPIRNKSTWESWFRDHQNEALVAAAISCVIVVGAVIAILAIYGVFSKSSSSSTTPGATLGTTPAPVGTAASSLVAGGVYTISPTSTPDLCIQAQPYSQFTQNGYALTLQTCSTSEPAQFWLYTSAGALSANYLDPGPTHYYMSVANGPSCAAGENIVLAAETSRTPANNEAVSFTSGQLILCGSMYVAPPADEDEIGINLQSQTSSVGQSWLLTSWTNPPQPYIIPGTTVTFDTPAVAGCATYTSMASGFALTYGGLVISPCSNWDPPATGGPGGAAGQFVFLQLGTGQPTSQTVSWSMTGTVTQLKIGTTYTLSYWYSVRASTGATTTADLSVFFGSTQVGSTINDVSAVQAWTHVTASMGAASATSQALTFTLSYTTAGPDKSIYFDNILISPAA